MTSSLSSPYQTARPAVRRLRVYARDPSLAESLATARIHQTTLEIPWEDHPENPALDGPAPGPVGEYLEVVDHDPSRDVWYEPVDLNHPYLLSTNGLAPSDGDPQFHQQMVYAVAMKTIECFERALGRRVLWAPHRVYENEVWQDHYVQRLRIYPHAMMEANAYYSPARKALMFGYFRAQDPAPAGVMPGATVFTCLSYDIIAHETAHAVLDGVHERFLEPSNPDVLGFHEALADIVALFQQFSIPDLLEHHVRSQKGQLGAGDADPAPGAEGVLGDLAREFGKAMGRGAALRQYAGKPPDPQAIRSADSPHDRGAILVAAVFQAFVEIYRLRSADLWRIAGHRGAGAGDHLHPDLVRRLAREAAKSASHMLNICIRAIDYLPPVDVTFGEYLRAMITADIDAEPHDDLGYRTAILEAFRRWGVFPGEVRSMAVDALRWECPKDADAIANLQSLGAGLKTILSGWNLRSDRQAVFEGLIPIRRQAHARIKRSVDAADGKLLGIDLTGSEARFEVHSVRPLRRIARDGQWVTDIVLEITQSRPGYFDPRDEATGGRPDFRFRGGCTLILDMESGAVRYCIYKSINSQRRMARQRAYLSGRSGAAGPAAIYTAARQPTDEMFAFLHREEAAASAGAET